MNSDFNVAVHALVYLDHKATTLSSEALADNICTNPARVRKVMRELSQAGLVYTREGIGGGYQLARPAGQITLREVADAVDMKFVGASWRSGDPQKECLVASGMGGVMDQIYDQLDDVCMQELEKDTIGKITDHIFADSGKVARENVGAGVDESTDDNAE